MSINNLMTTETKNNPESEIREEPFFKASSFLYDETAILSFLDKYVQVPFAGSNLYYLEKKMNGGLVGGKIYVLGVVPSLDRTVLLNNIADNVCLNGYPVLFFSYEDERLELLAKTLVRFSQYEIDAFYDGTFREPEALRELFEIPSVRTILEFKYVVDKVVYLEDWEEVIRQIKIKNRKSPVIFIDSLRKIRTKAGFTEERLRVDFILSRLSDLARRFNVPFMVASELARDAYRGGNKFSLGSFKESGDIEYEASWLGILADFSVKEKASEENGKKDLELFIFKASKGVGDTGTVCLELDEGKMLVRAKVNNAGFFEGEYDQSLAL